MLNMNNSWRFDSPGPIAPNVSAAVSDLMYRICAQGPRKANLECFKYHFATAAGLPPQLSSDESWAVSDLVVLMDEAAKNAPLFLDAFHSACEDLRARHPEMALPDATRINRLLAEYKAGYEIQGTNLVATRDYAPIPIPQNVPSLDSQAQELIEKALDASNKALAEGRGRQAVQELLWLLETISTAFRGLNAGDGSIQGRYFNKIIGELQLNNDGTHQKQILTWMMTLHGFLSSPTGGGIRHGVDLAEGVAVQLNEARLYCNLIRSYISFLIGEHERLTK
jgi:hypothetical protein